MSIPHPAPTLRWPGLTAFWPAPLSIDRPERTRMVCGGLVGILATALLCHWIGVPPGLTWIVAPMGASAVLVFGLPASPLAQPWAVVGGNTVSALVGIACVHLIPSTDLAAAAAVALAMAAMLALRCLHPPGGASALLMVMLGVSDPSAALFPVLANSLVLTVAGVLYNNATRRSYPHVAAPAKPGMVTEEDLDAVLAKYNQVLDVSRDDLLTLIDRTQRLAHQRRLADTRCADVMSRDVATVEFGTPLQDAWALLRGRGVKSLPVVDRARHVVGIVTLTDFLEAAPEGRYQDLDQRLRSFMRATPTTHSDKAEVVGQIMTRKVRVTRPQRTLSDLVLLFDSTGHRHIPVVDDAGILVGMVTQASVVAALKTADAAVEPQG
jgi:CBS domain-containing membrane protein